MAHLSPLIDITSLFGVESLFGKGIKDPWGPELAGAFADFFIYSDVARFTMPVVRGKSASLDDPTLPKILTKLRSQDDRRSRKDSGPLFEPVKCDSEEPGRFNPKHLEEALHFFAAWARNNQKNKEFLGQLLLQHREPKMRDGHLERLGSDYVYDVKDLRGNSRLTDLASDISLHSTLGDITENDILHGFDVYLRYTLYGEKAGDGEYYLAHPIRYLPKHPTEINKEAPQPNIPLTFSEVVCEMARDMKTLDEYTEFLHKARKVIWDREINLVNSGELGPEEVDEVIEKLWPSNRLSVSGKVVRAIHGVIKVVGAVEPVIGKTVTIVKGMVSVAKEIWPDKWDHGLSRVSWKRWRLQRDLKKQVGDPNIRMKRAGDKRD